MDSSREWQLQEPLPLVHHCSCLLYTSREDSKAADSHNPAAGKESDNLSDSGVQQEQYDSEGKKEPPADEPGKNRMMSPELPFEDVYKRQVCI